MMTIKEILADIKSDRKKKIILDCDAGNEIDDQYAIAYALGNDKLEVLSINAALFYNSALVDSFEGGMIESYNEIVRVVKLVGREDVPVYRGCATRVGSPEHMAPIPELIPVDSEAVDNIIKTAKESDELIYIVATGAVTNVSSAIAKDPSIKENICVIWVGTSCLETGAAEYNLSQDLTAGRYLFNCGVNLVVAPAIGDPGHGTQVLIEGREFLTSNFTGDDPASVYFRELPAEHDGEYLTKPDTWWHIYWDIAGPALLSCPENAELSIITAPRIRGDETYSLNEEGRHEIIYMEKIDPKPVLAEAIKCVKSLIK